MINKYYISLAYRRAYPLLNTFRKILNIYPPDLNAYTGGGSKKWVRMEESGRVDDEGRPILERVDLMEAFFAGVHRQI